MEPSWDDTADAARFHASEAAVHDQEMAENEATMTGQKLMNLTQFLIAYPPDIPGQKEWAGKLAGKHDDFEAHLTQVYSTEELGILRDAINSLLDDRCPGMF